MLSAPSDSCHEVVWAECQPSQLPEKFACLIVATVYYPESTKNRKELVIYLQSCLDKFRRAYTFRRAAPAFIVRGEFNQTNKQWLSNAPWTETSSEYSHPSKRQYLRPDIYQCQWTLPSSPLNRAHCKLADHFVILLQAKNNTPKPKRSKVTVHSLDQDSICAFGQWIGNLLIRRNMPNHWLEL